MKKRKKIPLGVSWSLNTHILNGCVLKKQKFEEQNFSETGKIVEHGFESFKGSKSLI